MPFKCCKISKTNGKKNKIKISYKINIKVDIEPV